MPTSRQTEYVALDVESTGLNPTIDNVIEVGLIVFDRDHEIARYTQTVRPPRPAGKDILRLTGLSQDDLDASPTFPEIAETVAGYIGDRPLVGHNIGFDISMLNGEGMSLSNRPVDTYQLATAIMPDLPNYQLGTISSILGYDIPVAERHRAMGDVIATVHVFRQLLNRLEQIDGETLALVAQFALAARWPEAPIFAEAASAAREDSLSTGHAPRAVPLSMRFLPQADKPEPLRPTGDDTPLPINEIEHLLGPESPLATVLDHYEPRPTQVTMARRIAQAFNEEASLLIEAGTGTGKSLAYLLPAGMFTLQRGERVVISTATIALQDQLYRKDVPDVRDLLRESHRDADLNVAVMKGRQNYICLKQWFQHVNDEIEDEADASLRARIALWLGQTTTGDKAELRLSQDEERHWRTFASERGRCTTKRCPYAANNQCFFHRARYNALASHIVIANHSLLLSNASEGRVLPAFERLVVDEAHHLEDEATRQLSTTVDRATLDDAVRQLVRNDGSGVGGAIPIAEALLHEFPTDVIERHGERARDKADAVMQSVVQITSLSNELFTRAGALIGKPRFGGGATYAQSTRLTAAMQNKGRYVDVQLIWDQLEGMLSTLVSTGLWFMQLFDDLPLPNDDQHPLVRRRDDLMIDLMTGTEALNEMVAVLSEALGGMKEEKVYWVQRSGKLDIISLNAAPLDVSALLNQRVYAGLTSVIMTSATMTVDGSFDFIAHHLGLTGTRVLDLGSPFDHEMSTLIFVPEDMPEPNDPAFTARLYDILHDTLIATRGRALVLFTSHRALREARNMLKGPLEEHNIIVLGQGVDGNSRALIERLRSDPGTVVFGTSTFWEGVDVVGDALSLVVIVKFPFAVPTDPIVEARSEQYTNAFMELSLPQAVLKFKQGFGRLIRTSTDRGVFVILDKRSLSKRYGSTFIQSLPPANVRIGPSYDLPEAASSWIRPPQAE